jgi:hypothetical protein
MWSAFITGAAEKASSLIDERDNAIKKLMEERLEDMKKTAAETTKKAQLRRDKISSNARELMSLGVPEEQAIAIIQQVGPEGTENFINTLKSSQEVTPEKIRLATKDLQTSQATLEDVFAEQATPMAAEAGPVPQTRGAFGLPSRAGQEFAAQAGRLRTELPELPATAKPLDMSVFAEADEETFTKRENAARMKILDAETDKDRQQGLNELNRILAIKDIGKDKEGDLKESDVRSNLRILDATIKQSIAGPGDLVVITDPATGERTFEYSKDIDPKVRNEIERKRREEFSKYIRQHYEQSGKVPGVVQRVTSAFLLAGEGQAAPAAGEGQAAPAPASTKTEVKAEGNLFYVVEPGNSGRLGPFKSEQEALNARDAYIKQKTK